MSGSTSFETTSQALEGFTQLGIAYRAGALADHVRGAWRGWRKFRHRSLFDVRVSRRDHQLQFSYLHAFVEKTPDESLLPIAQPARGGGKPGVNAQRAVAEKDNMAIPVNFGRYQGLEGARGAQRADIVRDAVEGAGEPAVGEIAPELPWSGILPV